MGIWQDIEVGMLSDIYYWTDTGLKKETGSITSSPGKDDSGFPKLLNRIESNFLISIDANHDVARAA